MAAIISSFSGGAVLTSRSVSGYWTSASVVGGCLFSTSLPILLPSLLPW